jgi:hypothetical protein
MAAQDLGNVPPFSGEPQSGSEAVAALDLVLAWCRAKLAASADTTPAGLEGLKPAVRRAWGLYQSAVAACPDLGQPGTTDLKVYDFLKGTLAGEQDGFRLPAFDTWQRYLSTARRALNCRKHEPRHARPHGRSIVREGQI